MTDNEVWLRDVAFSIEHGMPLQPSPKRLRLVADEIEQLRILLQEARTEVAGWYDESRGRDPTDLDIVRRIDKVLLPETTKY